MEVNPVQIGLMLVILGMLFIVFGAISQGESETDYFVGGFFGFIPFGFSNNKKLFWIGTALTIAFILFMWWLART